MGRNDSGFMLVLLYVWLAISVFLFNVGAFMAIAMIFGYMPVTDGNIGVSTLFVLMAGVVLLMLAIAPRRGGA